MKRITELMDKPLDWKMYVDQSNEFKADFELNDDLTYIFSAIVEIHTPPFIINMVDPTANIWVIEFSIEDGSFELTGTGNQFTVFATVADILKMFIFRRKPEIFYFSAKEDSRIRLYNVFAKKIAKNFKYNLYTVFAGDEYYIFERNF